MRYWFTWKGTDCRDKGVRLTEMPQIIRPQERVTHVTIPGRAGELTMTEDSDIYESYIQTIPLVIDSAANVKAVEEWLRGTGDVSFCCEPELQQSARVINAVQFSKHSRNSTWWEAEVQFYCDPMKSAVETEDEITVTESGETITNLGDVASRPLIRIIGSGSITIRAGGRRIALTDVESGWEIDSDLEWVMDENGNPLTGVYTGEFPRLSRGSKTIQFTGDVTRLEITPRWRYI